MSLTPHSRHSYWGSFASADLPNIFGSPNLSSLVQAGDTAYDSDQNQTVMCTDPTVGFATWLVINGSNVLTFAPGQTPYGNRFDDFGALYAAYGVRPEVHAIVFEDSAVQCTIPAAAYVWRNDIEFWGGNLADTVLLADGVTFNIMPILDKLITLEGQSNSPIIDVDAGGRNIILTANNYSAWLNNGTVPMIKHDSSTYFVSAVFNSGSGFYTGTSQILGLEDPGGGTAASYFTLLDGGVIFDDTIAGDGGQVFANLFLVDPNAYISNYQPNYASSLYDWVDLGIWATAFAPSYTPSQDISTASVTIVPGARKRYDPTGTGGAIVLGLPDKTWSRWPGMRCAIKNVSADATAVTVQPDEAGETIDGNASDSVAGANAAQEYEFDGISDWFRCII